MPAKRHPGLLQRMVNYIPESAPEWGKTFAKRQDELNRYLWLAHQTPAATVTLSSSFDPVKDPFILAIRG